MKCKFCGCADKKPCMIPISEGPHGEPALAVDGTIVIGEMACGWLIDNVCSAPACVEKAYAEAELLSSQIQFWLERESA